MTMLDEIAAYYERNRRVGHTTALLKGAGSQKAMILCGSEAEARVFRKGGCMAVSIHEPNALRGRNFPLVVDGFTFSVLAQEQREEIEKARNEGYEDAKYMIEGLKMANERLAQENSHLKDEVSALQKTLDILEEVHGSSIENVS